MFSRTGRRRAAPDGGGFIDPLLHNMRFISHSNYMMLGYRLSDDRGSHSRVAVDCVEDVLDAGASVQPTFRLSVVTPTTVS